MGKIENVQPLSRHTDIYHIGIVDMFPHLISWNHFHVLLCTLCKDVEV